MVITIVLGAAIIFRQDRFVETVLSSASLIFGFLLYRACLFLAEIYHEQRRYSGMWDIVKSTFSFEDKTTFIFMATVFFLPIIRTDFKITLGLSDAYSYLQNFLLVVWLYFVIFCMVEIRETGCDVGEALAWHYYLGYLKETLPWLVHSIGKSNHFRYKIGRKRLFILLPRTGYCYDEIIDSDSRVIFSGSLPDLVKKRCGIDR